MTLHTERFVVRPHGTRPRGAVSPNTTVAWPHRGLFASESVIGAGRNQPCSYFPAAHRRYAYAMRGSFQDPTTSAGVIESPFVANYSRSPSTTMEAFDALMGPDEARRTNTPMEQMRAWVSAAAPPLVYDVARARHEKQPTIQRRDQLAARYRAKAEERARSQPPPPMTFYQQNELTKAKLAAFYER